MDRARLLVFVLVAALLYLYARCASTIFPPAAMNATRPRNCTSWTFERYEASSFEKLFLANADAWGQRPCDALRTMQADADEWVALAAQSGRGSLPPNTSTNVMSSFYFRTCEGESVRVLIEPIGGVMRHPHTCTNFGYLLDKDSWLVLHWTPPAVRPARFLLFDIGASTWHSGAGGASQVWFWQEYRRRGVDFDELYAWEATAHSPKEVWAAIPPEVRPRYHWFNVPAETSRTMDNPLEVLRAVARPDDFVVMKLDIDTPAVEMPLVEQLLSDAGLAALVDEFFFEHHVNMEPLASCCWGTTAMKDTAAASYRLFGALRKLGIRAHSWV